MIAGTQLLGLGLGTGLGVLALKHLPMTEGQVSSITSLGVWAPLLVLIWESAALEQPISDKVFHLSWTTAMDVGVAAGLLFAHQGWLPLSRGRVMLINLGGALGFVLGSTMTLIGQSSAEAQATTMILLSVGGLAVGAMVTQDWDATHNSAVLARSESPTVLTMQDGKIKLGRLLPQVRPEVKVTRVEDQTHRTTGMSVHLGLLGGQF